MKSNSYKIKQNKRSHRCSRCGDKIKGNVAYVQGKKVCNYCFYQAKEEHKRKFK